MADLSQLDWAAQLEKDGNAVIIDVRTKDEIVEGYIPEAIHLDVFEGDVFIEAIKKMDIHKSYYLYCASGGRSGRACVLMNQLGFRNTYNLLGGFNQWRGLSICKH